MRLWQARADKCASLAVSVASLRDQPRLVEERIVDSPTLATYLERSAQRMNLAQSHLRSIQPEHPRRIKDSPYVETVTRVRLTDMAMGDIARLLWNVQREAPGLSIPELRVWVEVRESDRWEAELCLLAIAYSPQAG